MTALQVIEEIKIMTPQERDQIALFLSRCENELVPSYAEDEVVEKMADLIFERHAPLMKKLAS